MNRLHAELELTGRGKALFGAGEDDQSGAFGKTKELIDSIEVELRQPRQCGSENETKAAAWKWSIGIAFRSIAGRWRPRGINNCHDLKRLLTIAAEDHRAE